MEWYESASDLEEVEEPAANAERSQADPHEVVAGNDAESINDQQ